MNDFREKCKIIEIHYQGWNSVFIETQPHEIDTFEWITDYIVCSLFSQGSALNLGGRYRYL